MDCAVCEDLGIERLKPKLSKTQIDRLGNRLREGPPTEEDLVLLDEYRRSFGEAYETVLGTIREKLLLDPTGRWPKTETSILNKLRRESIRLSQVQDIAGCRIVIRDMAEQDQVVGALRGVFPSASMIDRRTNPSHGYRAIHIIAKVSGMNVEIQIRTLLQHLWARLSEIFSDGVDPLIKYGGGPEKIRQWLAKATASIMKCEIQEDKLSHDEKVAEEWHDIIRERKAKLFSFFSKTIADLEKYTG